MLKSESAIDGCTLEHEAELVEEHESPCRKRCKTEKHGRDDYISVWFSEHPSGRATVLKAHAVNVCHYIRAQLDFNQGAQKAGADIEIFGLCYSVARALRMYLQFDSSALMELPARDLKPLVEYYGLVQIQEELDRHEAQKEALQRLRLCSYCKVAFTEKDNTGRSCPRITLDAHSRLCVRCGASPSFCHCTHILSKHTEDERPIEVV